MVIKITVILATIISSFYAGKMQSQRNTDAIEEMKIDNGKRDEKIRIIEQCQQETAVNVATMNGTLTQIGKNVDVILQEVTHNSSGSNHN